MQTILNQISRYFCNTENCDWMNEDYLRLEQCDNPKCEKSSYSTCNILCIKCERSNENKHDTIYHCLDCIGEDTKYLDKEDEWNYGFDLCEECYNENPNFEVNYHVKTHTLMKIIRSEMIHQCCVCDNFYCHDCLLTSSSPILIKAWGLNDESEMVCRTICKECFEKFLEKN